METNVDEGDPISVLAFWEEFRDACNIIGVNKRVAAGLFPHFIKSLTLSACLSSKKFKSARMHGGRLLSYVDVISFFSSIYATDDGIARTFQYLDSYR